MPLEPGTFLEARPADFGGERRGIEVVCRDQQPLQFRCRSAAEARKWSSIVAAVVRTAEAMPESTESFLVKRVALASDADLLDAGAGAPGGGPPPGSGVAVDVRCLEGHSCALLAPHPRAGRGGEELACARCARGLAGNETLWRCETCNFDICRLCSPAHMVY